MCVIYLLLWLSLKFIFLSLTLRVCREIILLTCVVAVTDINCYMGTDIDGCSRDV